MIKPLSIQRNVSQAVHDIDGLMDVYRCNINAADLLHEEYGMVLNPSALAGKNGNHLLKISGYHLLFSWFLEEYTISLVLYTYDGVSDTHHEKKVESMMFRKTGKVTWHGGKGTKKGIRADYITVETVKDQYNGKYFVDRIGEDVLYKFLDTCKYIMRTKKDRNVIKDKIKKHNKTSKQSLF